MCKKKKAATVFLELDLKKGSVPSELSGRYSSLNKGKEAVEYYLRNKVKTKTVQRNEYADQREKER